MLRRALSSCIAAALVLTAIAPEASAGRFARPGAPGASAFRHDRGFLMRLSAGLGFNSASWDSVDGEASLDGVGGLASFAFGGIIAPNLAINADLFGLSAFEPTLTVGGVEVGDAESTRMTMGAIGIGLTYYLMPANIYFAASVGAGVGTLETRARFGGLVFITEEDTDPGLAVNVMIGKEWWLTRRWGLGVAGQVVWANLPTDNGNEIGVFGAGIAFTATFN